MKKKKYKIIIKEADHIDITNELTHGGFMLRWISKLFLLKLLIAIISLSGINITANAFSKPGLTFSPVFGYYNYNDDYTDAGAGQDRRSHFLYDVRLGYVFGFKVYLGAIYSGMSRDFTPGTTTRSSAGASVGFASNNFAILAHIYPWSEYNHPNFKAKDAVGFQLDGAYFAPLSKAFSLAMQFTYRSITYNTYTPTGGTSQSKTIKEEEYLPMIGFAVDF